MGRVRQDLLERVGLVETKVDSARVSIEAKIDAEISKVDGTMAGFGRDLSSVSHNLSPIPLLHECARPWLLPTHSLLAPPHHPTAPRCNGMWRRAA